MMARKLEAAAADDAPAGVGHNSLSQESYLLHQQSIIKANAKAAEVRSERNSIRKLAKSAGIELGKMDLMIKMLEWSPDEIRDFFRTVWKYAVWNRLAPDEQADMFGADGDAAKPDFAQDELDWEQRGWQAGLKGLIGKPPQECPGDRVQAWTKGWGEAQATLAPKKAA